MKFNNLLKIGKICSIYGYLGWFKIISFTHIFKNIFKYLPWIIFIDKFKVILNIEKWKNYKNNLFLVKFSDINKQKTALKFINYFIFTYNFCSDINKKFFYLKDLIKYKVYSFYNNIYLGYINYFIRISKDYYLMIINKEDLLNKLVIPFIYKKFIINIDFIKYIVYINWVDIN